MSRKEDCMIMTEMGKLLLHSFEKERSIPMKKKETIKGKWEMTQPMEQAEQMTDFAALKADPQGSYTGRPVNPYDVPVQDADDL